MLEIDKAVCLDLIQEVEDAKRKSMSPCAQSSVKKMIEYYDQQTKENTQPQSRMPCGPQEWIKAQKQMQESGMTDSDDEDVPPPLVDRDSDEESDPIPNNILAQQIKQKLLDLNGNKKLLVKKLTAEEKLAQHKADNHVTFDRNCLECLSGSLRDRCHRRSDQAEPRTLSVDVAGPFKTSEHHPYKFFLQATYTLEEKKPEETDVQDADSTAAERTNGDAERTQDDPFEQEEESIEVKDLPGFSTLPFEIMKELVVEPDWSEKPPPGIDEKLEGQSNDLIVVLYAGKDDDESIKPAIMQQWPTFTGRIIEIDICRSQDHNMLNKQPYAWLMAQSARGNVKAIIGGPNCRTCSVLRHYPGDSRPVRDREGPGRFGKSDLTDAERLVVREDDIMMWRMNWLTYVATKVARKHGKLAPAIVKEHPQDPCTPERANREGAHPDAKAGMCPSYWAMPEAKAFQELIGLRTVDLNQKQFGHMTNKMTTLETNIDIDLAVNVPSRRVQGKVESKALARWAPGLRTQIAKAVKKYLTKGTEDQQQEEAVQKTSNYKTLMMSIPLTSKRADEVMPAIQLAKIRLERRGHSVKRLHSDRGKEFDNKAMAQWCLNHDIYQTFAEAEDHRANGRVESAINVAKCRTRTLLASAAHMSKEMWPYALCYYSESMWSSEEKKFPSFGQSVMVKTRIPGRTSDFEPRAKPAWFLCPLHNSTGSLVMLQEGGIYRASTYAVLPTQPAVVPHERLPEAELGDQVQDGGITLSKLVEEESELLFNTAASLQDVKKDIDKWRPAMLSEINSLSNKTAISLLKKCDVAKFIANNDTEIIPGKAIFTKKKDGRLKCRAVGCGNFASRNSKENLYAGGNDVTTLRLMMRGAALYDWSVLGLDISTAFLNAPLLYNSDGKRMLIRPPAIFVEAGLVEPGDMWIVEKAVYGLREAPRAWPQERDAKFRTFEFQSEGENYKLEQMISDRSAWRVVNKKDTKTTCGIVIVYVDDVLVAAPKALATGVMKIVSETWACTPTQSIEEGLDFCGIEMYRVPEGIALSQSKYVKELLRRQGLQTITPSPIMFDKLECEDANIPEPAQEEAEPYVRKGQSDTGELLFLPTRTRPDIAYSVQRMANCTLHEPKRVSRMALRMYKYLAGTTDTVLVFPNRAELARTSAQNLTTVKEHFSEQHLIGYTDASFAPQGDKSQGCFTMTWASAPVFWRCSRQAFPTSSTAECELMEAMEGFTGLQNTAVLLNEMFFQHKPVEQMLAIDNSAAIVIAHGEGGSWRTRHLRVRAAVLRDRIERKELQVTHAPGDVQLADLGTKSLPAARLKALRILWNLRQLKSDAQV